MQVRKAGDLLAGDALQRCNGVLASTSFAIRCAVSTLHPLSLLTLAAGPALFGWGAHNVPQKIRCQLSAKDAQEGRKG